MSRAIWLGLMLSITVHCTGQTGIDPQKILDQLYDAVGNYNMPKPELVYVDSDKKVASYNSRLNTISIEQKVIDLCASRKTLGEDGLAFILAHELAHSFQSQSKESGFVTDFLAFDKTADASITLERNADIHGAFACHVAGYEIDDNISILLDSIYSSYKIKSAIRFYPTKAERKQSSRLALMKLDTLSKLFEYAQVMALDGQYAIAREATEHITQYYQGKELYNNIGVYYILEALAMGDENIEKFIYPIELNFESRLSKPFADQGSKSLNPSDNLRREILLANALRYFDEVKRLDKNSFDAYLNSCIAYLIKRDVKLLGKELHEMYSNLLLGSDQLDKMKLIESLALLVGEETDAVKGLEQLDLLIKATSEISILAAYNKESVINDCKISQEASCTCPDNLQAKRFKMGKIRMLKDAGSDLRSYLSYYHEQREDLTYVLIRNNDEFYQIIKEDVFNETEMNCMKISKSCKLKNGSTLFLINGHTYFLNTEKSN